MCVKTAELELAQGRDGMSDADPAPHGKGQFWGGTHASIVKFRERFTVVGDTNV